MVVASEPSLNFLPKAVFLYCMIECLSYGYPKLFWLRISNCDEYPAHEYNKERKMSRLSRFTLVYAILCICESQILRLEKTGFSCWALMFFGFGKLCLIEMSTFKLHFLSCMSLTSETTCRDFQHRNLVISFTLPQI